MRDEERKDTMKEKATEMNPNQTTVCIVLNSHLLVPAHDATFLSSSYTIPYYEPLDLEQYYQVKKNGLKAHDKSNFSSVQFSDEDSYCM